MQAICDVAFVHLLPKQNSTAGTVLTISETVHDKCTGRPMLLCVEGTAKTSELCRMLQQSAIWKKRLTQTWLSS